MSYQCNFEVYCLKRGYTVFILILSSAMSASLSLLMAYFGVLEVNNYLY